MAIARIARGVTKAEIAEATGARPNTVLEWERMEHAKLRDIYLRSLAQVLDTTVEWLVDGDIPRPPRPGEGSGYRGIESRLREVVGTIETVLAEVATPTPAPAKTPTPEGAENVLAQAAAAQAAADAKVRRKRKPRGG